jgi:hypothetical protein
LFVFVAAFMVLAVYAAIPAFAVHDTGVFELDKDATHNTATPPTHDWDQVCHAVDSSQCDTPGSPGTTVLSFDTDVAGQSIFTGAQSGGSSKDPQLVSGWRWKSGSVPDKDELLHGYAARYSVPVDTDGTDGTLCPAVSPNTTCELLYFGADRFDASGDAQIGFWFYQNRIACVPPAGGSDCTSNDSTAHTFSGEHVDGDILVLSDFVGGGETPSIKAFFWNFDPTPNSNPNDDGAITGGGSGKCSNHVCDDLIPLFDISNADCDAAQDGDGSCAAVNDTSETSPWSFTDKSGNSAFAPAEFYEGGINLSQLPGQFASECFSSFSVETRSSATPDAVLKDFILGNFGNCVPGMTTQASTSGPVSPGTAVHDTATVTITGATTTPDPTGPVTFFLCGPNATANPDCSTGGTNIGTGTLGNQTGGTTTDGIAVASSPNVNCASNLAGCAVTTPTVNPLAPGKYCFRAEWTGDSNYGPFDPPVSFTDTSTECFTVSSPTTTATRQFVYPQDKAKIDASSGGALAGSVRFRLYDTLANCTADGGTAATGMLYEEAGSLHPISGTAPKFATTNNTTVAITTGTTVYWRVLYDSTNPLQDDSSSVCTESTTVGYSGNDATITVP